MPAMKKLKKSTKSARPKRNFRDELKRIVAFLNKNDDEAVRLWRVLSALRGPDSDALPLTIKYATTAIIRHAIKLNKTVDFATVYTDDADSLNTRERLYAGFLPNAKNRISVDGHFLNHAHDAFEALNLSWTTVNQ